MRQYKFNKPLVETAIPAEAKSVYWVDVDERTAELANVMDFNKTGWQIKYLIDDIDIWQRSADKLDIPNKVKINPNGIIAAWLAGNTYEDNVKEAANAANFSYVIDELSELISAVNAAIPVISAAATAATSAGDTTTAEALEGIYSSLTEAVDGFNNDTDIIDKLEALDDAINEVEEEETIESESEAK